MEESGGIIYDGLLLVGGAYRCRGGARVWRALWVPGAAARTAPRPLAWVRQSRTLGALVVSRPDQCAPIWLSEVRSAVHTDEFCVATNDAYPPPVMSLSSARYRMKMPLNCLALSSQPAADVSHDSVSIPLLTRAEAVVPASAKRRPTARTALLPVARHSSTAPPMARPWL